MFKSVKVLHDNKDIIHDVAYDFHGKRIATCSSDQSVKIYDLNDKGQWQCTATWKTHNGSVWRVSWAHPEFGQLIATCSFDRTAILWEEVVSDGRVGADWVQGASLDSSTGTAPRTHWVKRATLVDSRANVTDVQFAPAHIGLQLATCSANGIVRIYDAPDITNLNLVHLQHELNVGKHRCSCLCWNPSKYHPALIAVGCDDPSAPVGKVSVFEFNKTSNKWARVECMSSLQDPVYDVQFAPNSGRSFHLLGVAARYLHIMALRPQSQLNNTSSEDAADSSSATAHSKFQLQELFCFDAHNGQVWRVSWNVTGTILSSAGTDGTVKLWKANYMQSWKCISTISGNESQLTEQTEETPSLYY